MSVIQPEFLKVLPADIAAHGFDGACVLALIRYALSLPGAHNGRVKDGGGAMWWQKTHREIGQLLGGINRYTVGRIMARLEESGALESQQPGASAGVLTKMYRPAMCEPATGALTCNVQSRNRSDQQCADSQQVADLQGANLQLACADSHTPLRESAHSSSSSVELREELGEGKKPTRTSSSKKSAKPQPPQPVAPSNPLRQTATGDGPLRPIDPAFVDAVVHVLRANRELTIDQIERQLRDHPNPTISAQSSRIALEGLRAAESDGRAAKTGRRAQNWASTASGRTTDSTYAALDTENWQRAS